MDMTQQGQAWGPLDPGGPWHLSILVQWVLRAHQPQPPTNSPPLLVTI